MPASWTAEHIQFGKENWKSMPKAEIADRLGKSLNAVKHYAYRYGWSQHEPASTYEHLTEAEKAYIAGIVDGEGHIEIGVGRRQRTRRNQYAVQVVISNTDFALHEWLARRIHGGTIREVNHGHANWKRSWVFVVRRRGSVRSLLTELLPHLVVKRTRALEALAAIASIKRRQWR